MKNKPFKRELFILLSFFLVSRAVIKLAGVSFGYNAIFEYWQYLDISSLSGNLLNSLWYQHSQPPVFNFLLGMLIKGSGRYTPAVMEFFLMAVTVGNGYLLLQIIKKITGNSNLSLILSLLYVLSPATMLFENELFYTTFISLLLLISVNFMIKFTQVQSWRNALGIFTALSLVCLTRSMYHLYWLLAISAMLIYSMMKKKGFNKILLGAILSIVVVGGWYVKNYLLFGTFSASSWTGMNFSRIVFQDIEVPDRGNIASVRPFMPISYYKDFIRDDYKQKYAGVNDRVLLMETKNDRFINMNNAGYLEVSKRYMKSCSIQVEEHPLLYLKNVCTSFIIFFTPASSYYKVAENNKKIWYYDVLYSGNPSFLFHEHYYKKLALAVAAIPKLFLYSLVFFIIGRNVLRTRQFPVYICFMSITILFTLAVSSLFEYGENMRFRYEVEPLFLIMAARAITIFKFRETNKIPEPMKSLA